jgi:hypothetical protein
VTPAREDEPPGKPAGVRRGRWPVSVSSIPYSVRTVKWKWAFLWAGTAEVVAGTEDGPIGFFWLALFRCSVIPLFREEPLADVRLGA